MATLTVFDGADQVLQYRNNLNDLRVSGLAVVLYVRHLVDPAAVREALESGRLRTIRGPTTYEKKFRTGSRVHYCERKVLATDPFGQILSHRLGLIRPVEQNFIWVTDSPVAICAIPLKIQVATLKAESGRALEFSPNFTAYEPFGISQLIDLLASVSTEPFLRDLAVASAAALGDVGVRAVDSSALDGVLGIDLWSLAGTKGRDDGKVFDGAKECAIYSWPLAAILNYSSDHIVNHFFDQVSHEEVFSRIKSGLCFMQDHGIFMNQSCVLEITHFGDWAPPRSWDRLRDYGFDSSTLFLLGIAQARNWSYRAIAGTSGDGMLRLTHASPTAAMEEVEAEHDRALEGLRLLDSLKSLHLDLREDRSQIVDLELQRLFGDELFEQAARQRVEAVRQLALDIRTRFEDDANNRGITRLTFAAVVLAVASIPVAADQLWTWGETGQPLKILVSGSVMSVALFLTTRAVRSRKK